MIIFNSLPMAGGRETVLWSRWCVFRFGLTQANHNEGVSQGLGGSHDLLEGPDASQLARP